MKLLFLFLVYGVVLAVVLARRGLRSASKISGRPPAIALSRLLIVGGTGGTGRQLLTQALERGYRVTALVREPRSLAVQHPHLTVMQGDVLDYSTVERAVRDQDAVICALGHKRFFVPTRILSDGTRNILRAMAAYGVRRFVCETSLGIGDSVGRMGLYYSLFVIPVVLPFYFWDKTRQEQWIAASTLEWVIVRPAALTDAAMRGVYRSGRSVGSFLWTARIARADVAAFMLKQLTDNAWLGTAVGICG
ncbi:MAG TPA: SDR family oxidoreductase [Candidatus Bathyarchaeia archaeon]|nr:SDR family oxidoreductase [Candidatus Bathyarchaeia archaeon]